MAKQKIGVFDSGVGGLTVYRQIKKNSNLQVIYFGDTKRAPYGSKGNETLKKYGFQIVSFLESLGCTAFTVACNTLSSNVTFDREVISLIEHGSKEALRKTKGGNIGLFATEATVRSKAFHKHIKGLKAVACPEFVPLIEAGEINSDSIVSAVKNRLLQLGSIDTLILGCTHYPLIEEVIKTLTDAVIIDPAVPSISSINLKADDENCEEDNDDEFYVSGDPEEFENFFKKIFGYEIKAKRHIL